MKLLRMILEGGMQFIAHVSRPTEREGAPNVSYVLRVIMMCSCGFILGSKGTMLGGGREGLCTCGGWGPPPAIQFCSEMKFI